MFTLLSEHGKPRILGHRGAPRAAPENTLAGFEAAAAQGADGFELDVLHSADDELVVVHDSTLDRTTDATGPVAERTAAELAAVDAGWAFSGAAGGYPFRGSGVAIPTLEAVLDFAAGPGLLVNVEVKADAGAELAIGAARLVSSRGEGDRVFLSSFSIDLARAAAEAAPEVAVALLTIGWAPLDALQQAVDAGCRGLHPDRVSLTEAGPADVVAAARSAGCWVVPWTVNDPDDLVRLARAGVAAIITDEPGQAREALARGLN